MRSIAATRSLGLGMIEQDVSVRDGCVPAIRNRILPSARASPPILFISVTP